MTIKRPTRWDNRATAADNAGLQALKLCWCFKPWHKVEVCSTPEEGTHAVTVGACTALLPPSSLPGPWALCAETPWISFQMWTMAVFCLDWLGAAQDVPPHSSIPSTCPCPQHQYLKAVVSGQECSGCGLAVLCRPSETALSQAHYCNIFSTQEAKETGIIFKTKSPKSRKEMESAWHPKQCNFRKTT